GILYSNVTHFDQIMSKYEGRIFLGTVNYDGATQAGVPLTFDGIPDLGYEFRGLWGRDNPLSDDFFLTPYIGVGYRYLNDNMQLKSAAGYQRESNYYYVPLGLEVTRHDDSGGFFEAMIEYDYLLFGKQVSHLSDFASEWNDPINWQHSGYGLKALISYMIESANFSYQGKLYMRLWDIADSDTANLEFSGVPVGTAIEPKNNTSEVGISLGVRF
ncbi:MAG: hypothetical protein HQ564_03810, partial [Candidatus Saganbacteria bacterium]|nr:hypothetical protein [Candidatus Saganbacteria bacterium]